MLYSEILILIVAKQGRRFMLKIEGEQAEVSFL